MALGTRIKANNTNALNLTTSWTSSIVPNSNYIGFWDATVTGANTVALGAAMSWSGIGVNNPGGAVTIGTTTANLTLGADGIDMSSATQNLTINSPVGLVLGANQIWSVASSRTMAINSLVSGAFSLDFYTLAGTAVLTNANTYSGGTTIRGSTVQAGASTTGSPGAVTNGPFGTGTVTMTGGKISSDSTTARTLANALSLNGTMTLGDATKTGDLTFSGTTNIAGPTTLTNGGSAITLSGQLTGSASLSVSSVAGFNATAITGTGNTYSGAFSLTSGAARLGNGGTAANQLATASSITMNAGTSLWYSGNTDTNISVPHSGSGELLAFYSGTITFSGNALGSYTGPVIQYREGANTSPGALLFSTNTAFPSSGGFGFLSYMTVASSFTLKYTGTGNVSNSGNCSLNADTTGSTVTIDNSSSGNSNLTLSGVLANSTPTTKTLTLTLAGTSTGTTTLSGNITDSATSTTNLSKTSSGTLTLSGASSTYKGSVSVTTGTLNANSATALGAASSTAAISVTSGATLSLGAALNYSSPGRTTTISGTGVSGAGALIHAFAGTANIGTINLGAAATIYSTASGTSTLSGNIVLGASVLTAGATSGNTVVLTGIISSTTAGNGLIIANDGTTALAGQNTFNGTVRLSNGTVRLDATQTGLSNGPLGSNNAAASLIFAGASSSSGILEYTATNTFDYSPRFEGVASTTSNVNTRIPTGLSVTWAGNWATNASVFLYNIGKFGGGTLRMTSTGNTRLGITYIYDGVVSFVSGSLADVSFNGLNAILKWEPGNTQDKSASLLFPNNYGQFDTNGNNVTFATSVWGIGYTRFLTKLGLGALTLTASSIGNGTTTITAGSIRAGQVDVFGTGSVVIGASGTLQTLTTGGQNGRLTVAFLTGNGGTIKIGG